MNRIPMTVALAFSIAAICLGSAAALAALPQGVEHSLAPMLEDATPGVVNIATQGHVEVRMNPLLNDPFFRRFFNLPNQPRQRKTQSLGSGVIVDAKRGLVLTNNHVIANADQITVKLRDGRTLSAELVGTDPDTDIGVVKIPPEGLTALPLADSDELRVGDFVVAIGNPFGLGQTVTSGIVSALARSGLGIAGYEDLIQTDASINPGNSGGALVNLRGELVGINTAIYSQSGGNIGIGFAIPANMAKQIMEQLVEFGEVRRGFLGAELQDLDPDLAEAFGLTKTQGAVLVNVLPDTPAAKAGLKAGDVVTAIEGKAVRSASDLRTQVGLAPIGKKLEVEYIRDGKTARKTITVGERQAISAGKGQFKNERFAGCQIGDIPEESAAYGRLRGVMVFDVERGTQAWDSGLRPGDVITSINRQSIQNLQAFLNVVSRMKGSLLLRVHRGNQAAYIVIK
ncbi:MAG: DegQ family serine endoprotease [Pseudomonadota bacterium]